MRAERLVLRGPLHFLEAQARSQDIQPHHTPRSHPRMAAPRGHTPPHRRGIFSELKKEYFGVINKSILRGDEHGKSRSALSANRLSILTYQRVSDRARTGSLWGHNPATFYYSNLPPLLKLVVQSRSTGNTFLLTCADIPLLWLCRLEIGLEFGTAGFPI